MKLTKAQRQVQNALDKAEKYMLNHALWKPRPELHTMSDAELLQESRRFPRSSLSAWCLTMIAIRAGRAALERKP